jgi:uncharacterized membrane protein
VTCVAWLIFFINHISQAISVNHIVDRIARETEGVIDDTMPDTRRHAHEQEGVPFDDNKRDLQALARCPATSAMSTPDGLLSAARRFKLRVRLLRRVGHFVPAGVALFSAAPG